MKRDTYQTMMTFILLAAIAAIVLMCLDELFPVPPSCLDAPGLWR